MSLMAGLELTPNMESLLRRSVEQLAATIIIISDSNTEFIRHILEARRLAHLVDKVFTNPASWAEDGRLTIGPYHHQESCTLSTKNLCKGGSADMDTMTSIRKSDLITRSNNGRLSSVLWKKLHPHMLRWRWKE